jgi:hypothetical protein
MHNMPTVNQPRTFIETVLACLEAKTTPTIPTISVRVSVETYTNTLDWLGLCFENYPIADEMHALVIGWIHYYPVDELPMRNRP